MENLYTGQGVGVEEDGDDDEDEVDGNVSRSVLLRLQGGRRGTTDSSTGGSVPCVLCRWFFCRPCHQPFDSGGEGGVFLGDRCHVALCVVENSSRCSGEVFSLEATWRYIM